MKHLKKSKRPVMLTVKAKAEAIVQDAGAYRRLLDEAIRQGLEEARRGKEKPSRPSTSTIHSI